MSVNSVENLDLLAIKSFLKDRTYDELINLKGIISSMCDSIEKQRENDLQQWADSFKQKYQDKYGHIDQDGRITKLKMHCSGKSMSLHWNWSHGHSTLYIITITSDKDISVCEIGGDGCKCTRKIYNKFPFSYIDERFIKLFSLYLKQHPVVKLDIKW